MSTNLNQSNLVVRFIQNPNFLHTLIAIAVFAIISWIYFYPDAMVGNVLNQHDVLQGVANGQEVKAFTAATGETSRWTNSLFSGMPNFQIAPSYQSSKLITWVGNAYSLWFPSPVNLIFIMMLGFYILLISFKVKWYIAIPGAIAWCFSTYFFILIGAGHIWKYVTLAYIPPTIAGIIWAYRGKYLLGGAVAAFFAMLQIASNHVQMTYYFLFLILGLMIAFLVLAIKEKKFKNWGVATGVLAVAAILAVAANSPNLYNSYKYSKETMRGGHSELTQAVTDANATKNGLDKDYITQWSYGKDETLSLLVPNIKGGASIGPQDGGNSTMLLTHSKQGQDLIKEGKLSYEDAQALDSVPFIQYFGDQPMTNGPVYVGALIMVLFLIGCFIIKGPIKWALVIVTLLSILLSWGHNFMWFSDIFIDYFPMYNKFRTVSSILVVAEFTIPLLAILALQKIFTTPNFFKEYKKVILASFGLCGLICLILIISPSILIGQPYSQPEVDGLISQGVAQQYPAIFNAVETIRYQMVSADALRSLMIIGAGLGIILLYANKNVSALVACGILTVIIVLDLFTVNKRYLNHDSFTSAPIEAEAKFTPRPADKQILQDTTKNYRVLDIGSFGEAMPSYFHKTIGGYHAAKLSRYQDIINQYIQISSNGLNINPAVIDMLNAKYIILDPNRAEINTEALGNAWFVDTLNFVNGPKAEIDALHDFNPATTAYSDKKFEKVLGGVIPQKSATDTIFETTYAPNKLTYHANSANGGLAVFSEVYFPWGWEATIDGKPVEIGRVNYILRAIKVPAGNHTIVFEFNPQSVRVTENIAYVSIILIYLGLAAMLVYIFTRKKEEEDKLKLED